MNTLRSVALRILYASTLVWFCAAALVSGPASRLLPPVDAAQSQTEILWDRWGVPHIFAPDLEQAMYAFGWAQMQSHGDLILRLYGPVARTRRGVLGP
jgi:acyl-homoserine lactone acylase PvdQ